MSKIGYHVPIDDLYSPAGARQGVKSLPALQDRRPLLVQRDEQRTDIRVQAEKFENPRTLGSVKPTGAALTDSRSRFQVPSRA